MYTLSEQAYEEYFGAKDKSVMSSAPINPTTGKPVKINPATGQPYKINPKTGLPFKKKKTGIANTKGAIAPIAPAPTSIPTPSRPLMVSPILKKQLTQLDKLIDSMKAAKVKPVVAKEIKVKEKPKVLCPDCDREMSSSMDVYYGRTSGAKDFCTDCRFKRFGEY